jgi:hypothetical protein
LNKRQQTQSTSNSSGLEASFERRPNEVCFSLGDLNDLYSRTARSTALFLQKCRAAALDLGSNGIS